MKKHITDYYIFRIAVALATTCVVIGAFEYLLITALGMEANFAPDGSIILDNGLSLELKIMIVVVAGIAVFSASMFCVFKDQLMEMYQTLEKLQEEERQREQIKNTLITSVAHDLRTPLTSTLGFLQLLNEYPDMEKKDRIHFTEVAYHKAARLKDLVEDLFAYTKFQQADFTLNLETLDMMKLLAQLMDEFSLILEEEEMEYELVSEDSSILMQADGNLIARLFENLIQNAIRYGKEGKKLTIKVAQSKEQVCVAVIDYGKMIAKEEQDLIFDKFYCAEYSRNAATGGNGLGLAIAQSIAKLHGGEIQVQSTPKETGFYVTLAKKLADF